jgi:hypothetical protein
MTFFPKIDETALMPINAVRQMLKVDPTYLDQEACPYSEAVKAFFRASGEDEEELEDIDTSKDPFEVLEIQIDEAISSLNKLQNLLEPKDKVAFLKVKMSLIQQALDMKGRLLTMREFSNFQNTIMTFLEDNFDKDKVADLKEKLK